MKYLILTLAALIALQFLHDPTGARATSNVSHQALPLAGIIFLYGVTAHWLLMKVYQRFFLRRYSRTGDETHARACREVIRIYSHRMFGKSSDYRIFIRQVEGHGLDYNSEGWKRFPSTEQALYAFRQWAGLEK